MPSIERARIRKILDSRGNPTVEVEVVAGAALATAAAPSGASTGSHEVTAFPPGGIDAAIRTFAESVAPRLVGLDPADGRHIDGLLHQIDSSPKFSKVGGNVAVAVSIACARAAAKSRGLPLYRFLAGDRTPGIPFPMGNVIGGGRHAIGGTTIQEFLSVARGPTASASSFANAEVHGEVRDRLTSRLGDGALGRGDEGAWVAQIPDETALEIVTEACVAVSKARGFPVRPALDFASSEFFRGGEYRYRGGALTPREQIDYVEDLVDRFALFSVEDPLEQEDYGAWADLTARIGGRCMVVGDDIFATNASRLERGIGLGAANAILIKPNQVGTLTDTEATVDLARRSGYHTVMSHRSGETGDDAIAHLAVAFGCVAIKTGAVGGERVAKLNELIRIEEQLAGA